MPRGRAIDLRGFLLERMHLWSWRGVLHQWNCGARGENLPGEETISGRVKYRQGI